MRIFEGASETFIWKNHLQPFPLSKEMVLHTQSRVEMISVTLTGQLLNLQPVGNQGTQPVSGPSPLRRWKHKRSPTSFTWAGKATFWGMTLNWQAQHSHGNLLVNIPTPMDWLACRTTAPLSKRLSAWNWPHCRLARFVRVIEARSLVKDPFKPHKIPLRSGCN